MKNIFKRGDYVKVNSKTSEHHGRKGRVSVVFPNGDTVKVVFISDDDLPEVVCFSPAELSKKWWG